MDHSLEVTKVKHELADSASTCRLKIPNDGINSIKLESNCLISSEIYIKAEPQEDESESPSTTGTFFITCPNYETDEPMIKTECDDQFAETIQNTLDPDNEIKVAVGCVEKKLSSVPEDEIETKTEESNEKEEDSVTYNENPESSGFSLTKIEKRKSNNKKQSTERNKQTQKVKEYTCYVCQQTYVEISHFKDHLRTHTGDRPFSCHICNKSFHQKAHLNNHLFVHTDEKPYACDVCKKLFKRTYDLDTHKLVHSDLKPFSCSECNISFRRKHALTRHLRIHTGLKPYICDVCDKAFTYKSDLMRHRRVHTGEKPYSCNVCNKSFTQTTHLNTHLKKHKISKLHPFIVGSSQ